MSTSVEAQNFRLGFMATLEVEGRGFVGGLLVTSRSGRPLEFQCTTPVKPDRTQVILYGRTLHSWLLGEVIGKALLERVALKPDVVVVKNPALLELRNHTKTPVVCLTEKSASEPVSITQHEAGRHYLKCHGAHPLDSEFLADRIHLVPDQADLEEPLDRVHEALAETTGTVLAR